MHTYLIHIMMEFEYKDLFQNWQVLVKPRRLNQNLQM
jgi:hypothetical protein